MDNSGHWHALFSLGNGSKTLVTCFSSKPEEVAFSDEYAFKGLVFRAERCFYLAKSYSLAGKKTEAFALYSRARSLADDTLKKLQSASNVNFIFYAYIYY